MSVCYTKNWHCNETTYWLLHMSLFSVVTEDCLVSAFTGMLSLELTILEAFESFKFGWKNENNAVQLNESSAKNGKVHNFLC